jgi:hypothetical protein
MQRQLASTLVLDLPIAQAFQVFERAAKDKKVFTVRVKIMNIRADWQKVYCTMEASEISKWIDVPYFENVAKEVYDYVFLPWKVNSNDHLQFTLKCKNPFFLKNLESEDGYMRDVDVYVPLKLFSYKDYPEIGYCGLTMRVVGPVERIIS